MKKILLISDTHGYLDPKLIKHVQSVDEVWHAGDIGDLTVTEQLKELKPLRCVWGNIDGTAARTEFMEDLIFMCEDMKIFITHIGGYPGKYTARVKSIIQNEKPNIYICGHSHILKVMFDKKENVLHMNPGAAGKSGFHQIKTALKFDIEKSVVKNLVVIELGPK